MSVFNTEFFPYFFGNCNLSFTGNGNPANKLVTIYNLFVLRHVIMIESKNNFVKLI